MVVRLNSTTMKRLLTAFAVTLMLAPLASFGQTITSISNGSFLLPTTWDCTCVPLPGADIIINHSVTLNTDYAIASGSITVNSGGSLTEDVYRNFAMNGGSFTNNGTTEISLIAINAGSFYNDGTMEVADVFATTVNVDNDGEINGVDSFASTATFTNGPAAVLEADQLYSSGTVDNEGEVFSINFWMNGSMTNDGNIEVDSNFATTNGFVMNNGDIHVGQDYYNSHDLENSATGNIFVQRDFLHGDSVATTPNLTNDGYIYVGDDWGNVDDMDGSGQWCVEDSTYNTGDMSGTFDFCDNTGGTVDYNIGTIGSGITFCTGVCNVGVADNEATGLNLQAYPNPFTDNAIIVLDAANTGNVQLEVYDQTGRQVQVDFIVNGNQIEVSRGELNAGIYYFKAIATAGTGTVIMVLQ